MSLCLVIGQRIDFVNFNDFHVYTLSQTLGLKKLPSRELGYVRNRNCKSLILYHVLGLENMAGLNVTKAELKNLTRKNKEKERLAANTEHNINCI